MGARMSGTPRSLGVHAPPASGAGRAGCSQAILDRVECGLKNGGKPIALERKEVESGVRRG